MTKFASRKTRPLVKSPISTTNKPTYTHEGGSGFLRDPKSELFLLAISNFVRENTFYESGTNRDHRFQELIHAVVSDDPEWVARMIPWLRNGAQMRSASVVAAAEYAHAGGPGARKLIAETLSRADEPAELLAYWRSTYGRSLPAAVKRGVADATKKLYTERNVLKYDGASKAWRFADVINLTHPKPKADWQSSLFKYTLEKRYASGTLNEVNMSLLPMISENIRLRDLDPDQRAALLSDTSGMLDSLAAAGLTWEAASEYFGKLDASVWEALIPTMGYMALLRNLRNFTEARISAKSIKYVREFLTDPEKVANSRQFPLRFYSAYVQTDDTWTTAIAEAFDLAVANVPVLKGSSLVLVDRSGSMSGRYTERGSMAQWQTAALFGMSLAKKNAGRVDLYSYDNDHERVAITSSTSILRSMDKFTPRGGTNTWRTVAATYSGQDRVIILTDEQAHDHGYAAQSINVPIYTFNVAGYKAAHIESGNNRYTFGGGLTDKAFTLLSVLEESKDGHWPF